MYTLTEVIELVEKGIYMIEGTVELELGDVLHRSFDDLTDLLDEQICESYLPKADCSYSLVGFTPGFYYASLKFDVMIEIDVDRFVADYIED